MNIVKRFFKNHNYSSNESAMIPTGQLYLVRSPSSPKSENECLYTDAILSIRDTNHPFSYQLVVWKGNSSDSDSLNDDEIDEADVNDDFFDNESNILKAFIIDSTLKICLFERYQQKIISWRDMEGDIGDMFEYRITSTVANDTIEQFMKTIYNCKYERKYRKSSANLNLNDIKEFIVDRIDIFNNTDLNLQAYEGEVESDDQCGSDSEQFDVSEDDFEGKRNLNRYDNNVQDPELIYENDTSDDDDNVENFVDASEVLQTTISADMLAKKSLVSEFQCSIFTFNIQEDLFKLKSRNSTVSLFDLSNWKYCIEAVDTNDDSVYVLSLISNQMDPSFIFEKLSFVFNVYSSTTSSTWLFQFNDRSSYESFQKDFTKLFWQTKNETKFPTKIEDEQYLTDSLNLMDISDDENDKEGEDNDDDEEEDEEDEEVEEEQTYRNNLKQTRRRKSVYSDESNDSDEEEVKFLKSDKNKGLVMGLKTDRAFISRGDKIGIFKTDSSGIQFTTSIDKLSFSNNARKYLTPDKMMLLDNDRTMIIQDNRNLNNLHKVDLEYGKVVEDWELSREDKKINVENFTTNKKFGDLTGEQTFLGISSQSMFRVDPRLSKGFVSDDGIKAYKSKTGFKQISTTGSGYIAVASQNGEIRLYDQLGKNAKTLLPALGDEIIGMSISLDGRYLLATSTTYLLLIDVLIQDGKFKDKLGFERSFSVEDKPIPRRLQLKPEHKAYIKQNYGMNTKFSVATFNETSKGNLPTYIISSIGPFAITWDFKKVINNKKDSYKLRLYGEDVVIGEFTNKNSKKMVLTLSNNVAFASTSSFRNPRDEFNVVETKF